MLLFALLLRLALHLVNADRRCAAGIQCFSGTVLHLGVTLRGLKMTTGHVVTWGLQTVAALMLAVGLTILLGLVFARLLKVESSLDLHMGGACFLSQSFNEQYLKEKPS